MSRLSVRALRVLTPASALASLVANAIALCSNSWLHSTELMPNPFYNGSGDREQLAKNTVSGLWKMCFNEPGKSDMHCVLIDYFPKEEYSPDPNDSTMAIPYAVKRASAFILISALVLVVGELLCFLGHLFRRGRVLTFAGGIAFILSGLMILVGMVIYISTFKAEVGSKLRPKSSFQEPLFTYSYGYSFLLAVTGLMSCELAGTFSIFLCIQRYQQQLKKKLDRLKPVDHLPGCRRYQQPLQRHSSVGPSQRLLPSGHSSSSSPPGLHHHARSSSARRHHQHAVSEPGSLAFEPPSPPPRLHHHGRPRLPASESMRDLSYYNFPPFSRDTTCNTVSTTADNLTREYSREFSFETLRRTTPV
ncbi:stargazin-like protein [Haemaphysalis longicornis]